MTGYNGDDELTMTDDEKQHLMDTISELRMQMANLLGLHGGNGKVGDMERRLGDHEFRVRKCELAIAKGYILAGTIAAVGSAVLSWAVNHF